MFREFTVRSALARLIANESGATSIEYVTLAVVIAVACIWSFYAYADSLGVMFTFVGGQANPALGS